MFIVDIYCLLIIGRALLRRWLSDMGFKNRFVILRWVLLKMIWHHLKKMQLKMFFGTTVPRLLFIALDLFDLRKICITKWCDWSLSFKSPALRLDRNAVLWLVYLETEGKWHLVYPMNPWATRRSIHKWKMKIDARNVSYISTFQVIDRIQLGIGESYPILSNKSVTCGKTLKQSMLANGKWWCLPFSMANRSEK